MTQRSSRRTTPRPSTELALLSALVVRDYNPSWLSGPVKGFIARGGPSLESLSRLKARLLPRSEELLREARRRGRPPSGPTETDEAVLLRELLALVPPETWGELPRQRKAILVETQGRLKRHFHLTQRRFCELLKISDRTFRSWKHTAVRLGSRAPLPQAPAAGEDDRAAEKKSPASRATGRFDLEVTLPGVQAVADTSDWELFGVPLKIVAVQDPGARRERLWEDFALELREDSELVVETVARAVKPGTQVVTDQGTPYMSERTSESLRALECDHAPQKEAAPTEKATKERAFRTVKDALRPLVKLSRRLAEEVPALKSPRFARAAGRILLSTFLRVYEAAPREGGHPLAGRPAAELELIAQEQREKARAESRSKRLFLRGIHEAYNFPGSWQRFAQVHRRHALQDLQEAERRMRTYACRCRTRACDRYFAAVLADVAEKGSRARREERLRELRYREQLRESEKSQRDWRRREALRQSDPGALAREALDLISLQWLPAQGSLLAGGRGLGSFLLRQALGELARREGHGLRDAAEVVWKDWRARAEKASPGQLEAVEALWRQLLAPFLTETPCTPALVRDRVLQFRPRTTVRPPTRLPPTLRN